MNIGKILAQLRAFQAEIEALGAKVDIKINGVCVELNTYSEEDTQPYEIPALDSAGAELSFVDELFESEEWDR